MQPAPVIHLTRRLPVRRWGQSHAANTALSRPLKPGALELEGAAMHSSSPRPCSPANRSSRSRRWTVATAIAFVAGGVLAGCGSDKPQEQPTETAPVSVVDGRQGAGPGGANNNGKDTGDTAGVPQT